MYVYIVCSLAHGDKSSITLMNMNMLGDKKQNFTVLDNEWVGFLEMAT